VTGYTLSPAAQNDLGEIWDYTREHWGIDQAEQYLRKIQQAIERILDNPMIGRSCETVRPGYRIHGVGSHRLYFRIPDGPVEVIRILHQRMDVAQHLA